MRPYVVGGLAKGERCRLYERLLGGCTWLPRISDPLLLRPHVYENRYFEESNTKHLLVGGNIEARDGGKGDSETTQDNNWNETHGNRVDRVSGAGSTTWEMENEKENQLLMTTQPATCNKSMFHASPSSESPTQSSFSSLDATKPS